MLPGVHTPPTMLPGVYAALLPGVYAALLPGAYTRPSSVIPVRAVLFPVRAVFLTFLRGLFPV